MELENKIVESFLAKSSFTGLLTLYFTKLRYDKKQGFSKLDFEKINKTGYAYGYFVAAGAIGLFESTIKNDIITITKINKTFSDQIGDTLLKRAEERDKAYPNSNWKDLILTVENI